MPAPKRQTLRDLRTAPPPHLSSRTEKAVGRMGRAEFPPCRSTSPSSEPDRASPPMEPSALVAVPVKRTAWGSSRRPPGVQHDVPRCFRPGGRPGPRDASLHQSQPDYSTQSVAARAPPSVVSETEPSSGLASHQSVPYSIAPGHARGRKSSGTPLSTATERTGFDRPFIERRTDRLARRAALPSKTGVPATPRPPRPLDGRTVNRLIGVERLIRMVRRAADTAASRRCSLLNPRIGCYPNHESPSPRRTLVPQF